MTTAFTMPDRLYIGGDFVRPSSAETDTVINPATEQVIGEAPVGSMQDLDAAIAAARDAFDRGPWPRLSRGERARILQRFHDELVARKPLFCEMLIAEAGCILRLVDFMFEFPMKHMRYAIEESQRDLSVTFPPFVTPAADGTKSVTISTVERDPVGVVAAITAYNYPYSLAIFKISAALAMGNSVILKPSPLTPFVTLGIGEAAHAAGLPAGVLNIVTGGNAVGEKLTSDPRVDMVSFTGSDRVGAAIMAQAAPSLKRVVLELGGKSPLIVRQDADLQKAVAAGLGSFTLHCGQGCSLTTRHIVHNSIRQAYVDAVVAAAAPIRIGDPRDSETGLGPLIRASQRERVEQFVEGAKADGARLALGGRRPADLTRGYYYEPTLFDDVQNSSALAQGEVFGPVAAVIGFDSDEEAIAIANDTEYGLGGAIFSRDAGAAFEMARQVRTGSISVNCLGGSSPHGSMGGIKRSGIGKELGIEGLYAYTVQKTLTVEAG